VKREESTGDKIKRSFDRYVDKIKILDNAVGFCQKIQ
jgi:hypothetical protein